MKTTSTRSFEEMKDAMAALLKKEEDELVPCYVCRELGKPEKLFRVPGPTPIFRHHSCVAGSDAYLKHGEHLSFHKYYRKKGEKDGEDAR